MGLNVPHDIKMKIKVVSIMYLVYYSWFLSKSSLKLSVPL
ncbi:MAG: hypothetical protein BROFUL_02365 [Candidatus Brocadia fulgida]|uniref:Uncharacterized protein n=1 Tax=Candidatus Brocadia fulgida TaxID=380242 RepID=A0A0M2USZ6_9BACT|nr:MAG: hypothetical protein BROFUL_02365 [Candidatus Brocadia fulgida]